MRVLIIIMVVLTLVVITLIQRELYGIGNNGAGNLANGNTTDQSSWIQIGGSENFSAYKLQVTLRLLVFVLGLVTLQDKTARGICILTRLPPNGMPFRMFGYNGNTTYGR